jgi:hypothetical protein
MATSERLTASTKIEESPRKGISGVGRGPWLSVAPDVESSVTRTLRSEESRTTSRCRPPSLTSTRPPGSERTARMPPKLSGDVASRVSGRMGTLAVGFCARAMRAAADAIAAPHAAARISRWRAFMAFN